MSAKPPQESLDFGRLYRVSEGARIVYRHLNDAVDQIGIVTASGACGGVDRGDLRKALDRGSGEQVRRVGVEHAMAIAAVCSDEMRKQIVAGFIKPLDLMVCDARPPMTDKERADIAEAVIRSLGPLASSALEAAHGGRMAR